ncbi:MAG: hypothetical protein ACD_22C00049G0002 [uncultured bacterium]|uniref:SHOCT domain-containing protein n=1 Tax=candidate division WWE3 bacterium TaxID=2053526 RepID=A0A656PQN8_UNCKA|nr:hypothetical protein P147_WWE3C00001G0349 [candidate division WWE3 bacterium RAAC2_WWE3_1]EKE00305.1 MAG: hypothetical protein ACD_22C00049G0002 [uncultured bacterium]KKS29697.1 MAG: hypothetical protein UU91_C0004G0089 [candidate division WWE3 bacterium GW2011_GWB1_42_117]KKS55507.1 MAG: hypothetical protein UV21_C0001G0089 [candidate division WWE3 bacterium GW2011_GWD2_42_34]KKT05992.1 MAG: hypothetical protein UV83_C0001G0310 [candidate division WWE3 bacterium GW2011_GWE2_43_18]KKT06910.
MMYGFYNMMDWGIFGWVFMLLFWILLIIGGIEVVRVIFRSERDNRNDGPKSKTPLEILKERYAKGEIDKNEFEEKKKDLME